jgi:hypothetical protein
MRRVRGRSFLAMFAVAVAASACSPAPEPPRPTNEVAALTEAPNGPTTPEPPAAAPPTTAPTTAPNASPTAEPTTGPEEPSPSPSAAPNGTPPPPTEPSDVQRSSLNVTATYDVNALISVGSGRIEMAARIEVTNESGEGIDRLELNTIAARLGGIKVTESTVEGERVRTRVKDQTLVMPLGRVLADGASVTILIGYRATLRPGLTGSDWMFSSAGGTIAMHRWIPWVSRAIPFGRPNEGVPFLTASSPSVEVEVVTDTPMVLAAPAADVSKLTVGRGQAWAFTLQNVRDVSVVLAPDFGVLEGEVRGVPIRVYSRYGAVNRDTLLGLAEAALRADADLLGIDYPWTVLTVVETEGGEGLETPGLVWVPRTLDPLNRTYVVHHVVAHQWFYGLVGYNQRTEPFAGEAMADLLARTATGNLRASRCPITRLDLAITGYSSACYYETVQVQGGLVLDAIRQQMGSNRFWGAVRRYLEDYRYQIGGTRELLDSLVAGSKSDIRAILRARFPGLY